MDILTEIKQQAKHSKQWDDSQLISLKALSEMIDVKVWTLRKWITRARQNPSPDSIPFLKMPGSGLLRFSVKEIRQWYQRGRSRDNF